MVINKIIYFDRETISNILEELNRGEKVSKKEDLKSFKTEASVQASGDVKLSIPFWDKIKFLLTGKISVEALYQRNNNITISSTEISEFEELKESLDQYTNIQIEDIENSSSFFRVAVSYLRFLPQKAMEGVDIKEFNKVLDGFEGYDTYVVNGDDNKFLRFNNSAFISNYRRNDLLTTKIDVYCIYVGEFYKNEFNFLSQINKMGTLVTSNSEHTTIDQLFPPEELNLTSNESSRISISDTTKAGEKVKLFDVVYASISKESR